jgi:hypothetical protein
MIRGPRKFHDRPHRIILPRTSGTDGHPFQQRVTRLYLLHPLLQKLFGRRIWRQEAMIVVLVLGSGILVEIALETNVPESVAHDNLECLD